MDDKTFNQNEILKQLVNDGIEQLGDKGEDMMVTNAIVIASVMTLDGEEKMWVKATKAAPWTMMGMLGIAQGKMDQAFFGGDDES